ncbi:hypothetical protein [Candidatus Entotheonella palauensis]|uniref:hypothetical protein n=1 Tax=Candidatus Entotheonella palauensis TaxID=93172 RepID=UPI000B7DBEB5|nr:hypothetical protein [Candidatus Entotheonella palauensis]
MPSLTVGELTLKAGPDKSAAFTADLAGQWEIPVGVAKLDISTPNLVLSKGDSGVTGTIGGTMTVAGVSLDASWELPKDFELSAGPLDIDFTKLLSDLAGAILPLPSGFPTLALTDAQVDISEADGDYTFDLQGQAGSYGNLDVEVLSGPKAAVAFALPAGWSLSNLNGLSAFSTLDFNRAGLVLASFTDDDFTFPETGIADNLEGIEEGAEFFASITLSGGALGVVGKIFQADTAYVRGVIATDPSKTELTASESGDLEIVPGVALSDVSLILKAAEPPSVTLQASSVITIQGDALTFSEDTTISPDDVSIALALGSPWRNPFGIGGLTIETVILSIEVEPAFAVGIYGDIDFGKGVEVKVGAQFVDGETPDFLEAELDGTVTLTDVIETFTSIKPPSALSSVSISNFKIYVVANPLGVTIGTLTFPPGFSFHGTIDFFGFTVTASVDVSETRLSASGTMSKLDLGGIFVLSDASGAHCPDFSIDTSPEAGAPVLAISAKAVFMGLSESVSGEVTDDGFFFELKESLHAALSSTNSVTASYQLGATFAQGTHLTASGSVRFKLHVDIESIELPGTSISLGTVHLHTTFKGDVSVDLKANRFRLKVTAELTWGSDTLTMPTLNIHVSFSSLDQLPGKIWQHIESEAWQIFGSILDDADKMLEQAGQELITLGDDLGQAFKDFYQKSDQEAAQLLHDVSWAADQVTPVLVNGWKLTSQQAAVVLKGADYTADQVADALTSTYNLSATAVAEALKGAEYTADQVSEGLQSAFTTIGSTTADALAGVESGVNTVVNTTGRVVKDTGNAITHTTKTIGHALGSIFG